MQNSRGAEWQVETVDIGITERDMHLIYCVQVNIIYWFGWATSCSANESVASLRPIEACLSLPSANAVLGCYLSTHLKGLQCIMF